MEKENLDVYSSASNMAVVTPPGRRFPGVVVQGDSLRILAGLAIRVHAWLRARSGVHEEISGAAMELASGLVERCLHYQRVLGAHGSGLPYTAPLTENDLERIEALSPVFTFLALRTSDLERSRRFYVALGLTFQRQRHDGGVEHYACPLGGTALELYPASASSPVTTGVRFGVQVSCTALQLEEAVAVGGRLVSRERDADESQHAVLSDPDGNVVHIQPPL